MQARKEGEWGSVILTPEVVEKLPKLVSFRAASAKKTSAALADFGITPEPALSAAKELLRVYREVKNRRAESVRDVPRRDGTPIVIPALSETEIKLAVASLEFPREIPADLQETLMRVAEAQFLTLYGQEVTVTPVAVDTSKQTSGVTTMDLRSGPNFHLKILEQNQRTPVEYIGYCTADKHWAYDFIVTPELLDAQKELRRDYEAMREEQTRDDRLAREASDLRNAQEDPGYVERENKRKEEERLRRLEEAGTD